MYNIQYGNSHLNIYTIMLKPILRQINLLKCYSEKVEEWNSFIKKNKSPFWTTAEEERDKGWERTWMTCTKGPQAESEPWADVHDNWATKA